MVASYSGMVFRLRGDRTLEDAAPAASHWKGFPGCAVAARVEDVPRTPRTGKGFPK